MDLWWTPFLTKSSICCFFGFYSQSSWVVAFFCLCSLIYQQRTAFFFFFGFCWKCILAIFLKLVFLFTCQDNHNPFYYLLGRLLQYPFPFFNCIKYSDHLILHLVSSVFFVPFSYVFSHNHSKPFNFLQL